MELYAPTASTLILLSSKLLETNWVQEGENQNSILELAQFQEGTTKTSKHDNGINMFTMTKSTLATNIRKLEQRSI